LHPVSGIRENWFQFATDQCCIAAYVIKMHVGTKDIGNVIAGKTIFSQRSIQIHRFRINIINGFEFILPFVPIARIHNDLTIMAHQ
jgi:hypothetical protein